MKNLKKQSGITLVALVVTIIVLLILAGVSLSLVAGTDGILGKASTAAENTHASTAKEEFGLLVAEKLADYYDGLYVSDDATAKAASNAGAYIFAELGASGITSGEYGYTITAPASGETDYTVVITATNGVKTAINGSVSPKGALSW